VVEAHRLVLGREAVERGHLIGPGLVVATGLQEQNAMPVLRKTRGERSTACARTDDDVSGFTVIDLQNA
jgi:hypothetical protein